MRKIWQFSSPKGYKLGVTTDRLSVTSEHHKTYNQSTSDNFRDVIDRVIASFLAVARIPEFSRVGLRYIDHCPVFEKTDDSFAQYYQTCISAGRFSIADAALLEFRTVTAVGEHQLRYHELLREDDEADSGFVLVLDFDGFAQNVPTANCLAVTDELHEIISDAFEQSIKEPLFQYMREGRD